MFKKVGKQLVSPVGLGLLFCVGLLVVIFSAQSWALLPAYAPYAILLLCPLMHLFMHRGMHSHGAESQGQLQKSKIEED